MSSSRREWFRYALASSALVALAPRAALAGLSDRTDVRSARRPLMEVRKNPGCGCCDKWVDHLKAAGFEVRSTEDPDLYAFKQRMGVPRELVSCHTGVVDGYVVEGHVPIDLVQRMITEKPNIAGIGVGGMPAGSPGMESPRPQPYDVIAFTKDGRQMVYARR